MLTTSRAGGCDVSVDGLTEDNTIEPLKVQVVKELTILGTKIDDCDSTETALKYRMEKAEKAFWSNRKIVRTRGIPLKLRMREYARRVVPVFLHGCGGWSWSVKVFHHVHGFEGRLLGRVLGCKKKKEEEWEQFWRRRILFVRECYANIGERPLTEKVLEKIFDYSCK